MRVCKRTRQERDTPRSCERINAKTVYIKEASRGNFRCLVETSILRDAAQPLCTSKPWTRVQWLPMADADVDTDALESLEKEAKEFDKVSFASAFALC
jgi:hypothetical protein